jgi:hypothetical protein
MYANKYKMAEQKKEPITYVSSRGGNDYEIHALRIVPNDFVPKYGESFITDDYPSLHLNDINIFNGCSEEGYNEFANRFYRIHTI